MSRRINLISLCLLSALFIFFLYASHLLSSPNYTTEYYRVPQKFNYPKNSYKSKHPKIGLDSTFTTTVNISATIDDVLNEQRERISDKMMYYEYPGGRFGVDAEKLTDLTMETDGQPMRSVIITTWRSGSTFLGDILNAMPGNFYHYEPLLNFDIIQIRGPPHEQTAIQNLKNLLKCDYSQMDKYLDYGKDHTYLFTHNTRLWKLCKSFPQFCWEPKFLTPICKLFPLQSMKVVRLRMNLAAQLLEDESLNTRIVLLIRDPRGALQSRKHRDWCPGRPDCDHPATVCSDMVSDYYSAVELNKKFPHTFRAIRYEDLSRNPYEMTQDILQFYGLPFDPEVEEFLDSHTKSDIGGVSSTFRDSKSAPFHWIKDLSFKEVLVIQDSCTKAMELWGYKKATNETIIDKDFDPMLEFPFS